MCQLHVDVNVEGICAAWKVVAMLGIVSGAIQRAAALLSRWQWQ